MLFLVLVPYIIILFGLLLGYAGVRPAMLAWAICMLGALSGLGIGLMTFWETQLWVMTAIAGLPFAVVALKTIKDLTYPLINDVTTDVNDPPNFVAALVAAPNANRDMAFPVRFGPIIRKSYPALGPVLTDASPQQVLHRARDLINESPGWMVKHCDETNGTIEAEVTTAMLGFVDDVVIRVSDLASNTRVDMRSKSREGLVDGGCNATRIQAFLERLSGPQRGLVTQNNPIQRPSAVAETYHRDLG